MLQIFKKEEIKAQKSQTKFQLQSQTEQSINNILNAKGSVNLVAIANHYAEAPSISSKILAHIIQRIVSGMTEVNLKQSIMILLILVKLPHDERELKYFLKNTYKIDAKLLLLALWDYRHQSDTIKIVSVTLDCYPAQLMLNAKDVVTLWKEEISKKIQNIQSRDELLIQLNKQKNIELKSDKKKGQFRKVIVRL